MNALIIGASRGIGLEFVHQHRTAGARVTTTAGLTPKDNGCFLNHDGTPIAC